MFDMKQEELLKFIEEKLFQVKGEMTIVNIEFRKIEKEYIEKAKELGRLEQLARSYDEIIEKIKS
jgi:cob(I)alamin adenosyltransferase